jgi:hypothetical protein
MEISTLGTVCIGVEDYRECAGAPDAAADDSRADVELREASPPELADTAGDGEEGCARKEAGKAGGAEAYPGAVEAKGNGAGQCGEGVAQP